MSVELIACESCGGNDRDAHGKTRGEQLITHLRASSREGVKVSTTRCLWNCQQSCSLHARSRGRVGYVIGRLEASAEMANALLDWAELYRNSADGAVPFKTWPPLMKGHFICRIPAAEE